MKTLIKILCLSVLWFSCEEQNEENYTLIGTWVSVVEEYNDDLVAGDTLRIDFTLVLESDVLSECSNDNFLNENTCVEAGHQWLSNEIKVYNMTNEFSLPNYPGFGDTCVNEGSYTTTDTEIHFFQTGSYCIDPDGSIEYLEFNDDTVEAIYLLSEDTLTITYPETDWDENGNEFQTEFTIVFTRQ